MERAVALQIFGLESKCLNSEVRAFLRVLLDTKADVNSFVNHQLACCGKKPFPDCIDRIRNDFRLVLDRRVAWNDFTIQKLREFCVRYGVSGSGNKSAIVQRLQESGHSA